MRVRVPADVDMADRIFAGLTARQLLILGGHGTLLLALYVGLGESVPLPVFGAVAAPIALIGLLWATTSPEGTTWERIGLAALRHFRTPRRHVLAPEGLQPTPDWLFGADESVTPLELPVQGASPDGHVDLGSDGVAAICRASSINLALRSEAEQMALVEGFARLLNALDAPIQFLVRSNRADLRGVVEELEERAAGLPHPALEAAAKEHAAFLGHLAALRDVLHRQVLVCFREPAGGSPKESMSRLDHRVEESAALLRGMGIRLVRLEGEEATDLLVRASDPEAAPPPRGAAVGSTPVEGTW
ncbi:MAG TPA: PrgI family protein [Actinomycetota bacterium]|nr:PrgI family protein [Actinomycetota bacterium]